MSQYRILVADNVHPGCDEILSEHGFEVVREVGKTEEHLSSIVGEFDAMVVRSAVKVTRPMIEKMGRMKVIGRAGAGVDNIDVQAATERGIVVMNTPGGNTISAAEHTVGMILSVCRHIPQANESLRNGQWNRKAFVGTELFGKTVGVLGVGRIGGEVAKRLRGFEVRLLGCDPILSDEHIRELGLIPVSLDELLEQSDILTLHLPLIAETKGIIGADELARMKSGAYIVHCARGGIVNEAALLAALEAGTIAGAALDVFEQEPPTFPNNLIAHPRVVSTPHLAASTEDAQIRVSHAIAQQIGAFLKGEQPVGVVNSSLLTEASSSSVAG